MSSAKVGDRVRLLGTSDEYTNLRYGDEGTVVRVSEQLGQTVYDIQWQNGSTLSLIPQLGDRFEVVGG